MDDFLHFGSDQACSLLKHFGSAWYESTCMGFENGAAYDRAGMIFWAAVVVLFAFVLVIIRSALKGAFE